jgi:hypothetical protein
VTHDDDPLRLRTVIAAPVDRVWDWLTEPALIGRWFGWEHDSLDHEIEMIFVDGVAKSPSLRRFETNGGGLFTLRESPAGTVLELRRRDADLDQDAPFDAVDEGWTTFVQALRLGVERHPDEERRAIELQGRFPHEDAPGTWAALGLDQAAGLEVGAPYEARTPFGEALSGEVWFHAPHQLGLTVDAWGGGLLVAVERPPDDERPHGAGQLVLTSYGLDEVAFAEHFQRWTRWARETFAR